ncbi:MAG TPA: glycosyltransferase, partial [Vicinamibacterales bacterium]
MAATSSVGGGADALPRLLYIGDVSVADTMAGEALLYRLLQFYPPEKLSVICAVRPGMPKLPGVEYHHWGLAWPRLLHSRVAEEYVLWHAWRYYKVPAAIARIASTFKAEAILSISHVSAWLAAWQLSADRKLPLHLIAHDDFVYASRFPAWARPWATEKFGDAYRAAAGRYCISDTMAESYRQRFGVDARVIFPAHKGARDFGGVSTRLDSDGPLTFAYGGSINSATDLNQIIVFARAANARGHRLLAFTPQHALLAERARAASAAIETHAPIHSDELAARLRAE